MARAQVQIGGFSQARGEELDAALSKYRSSTSGYAGGSGGAGSQSSALDKAGEWLDKNRSSIGSIMDQGYNLRQKEADANATRAFSYREREAGSNFNRNEQAQQNNFGRQQTGADNDLRRRAQMSAQEYTQQKSMQSDRLGSGERMQTEREQGQTNRQANQIASSERMQGAGHTQERDMTKLRATLDSQKTEGAFNRAVNVFKGKF